MSEPIYIDQTTGVQYIRSSDGKLSVISDNAIESPKKVNAIKSIPKKAKTFADPVKKRPILNKINRSLTRTSIIHTHNREITWKSHEIHITELKSIKYVVVDGFVMSDVIDTIITGYNDIFQINGITVTLVEGTYTADTLSAMIQESIYTVSDLVSLGISVTVHSVSKKLILSATSNIKLSFETKGTAAHVMGFTPGTSTTPATTVSAPYKIDVSSVTLLSISITPSTAIGRINMTLGTIPCTPVVMGGNRPFYMDIRNIPDSHMHEKVTLQRLSMEVTDHHGEYFPINRYRYTLILSVFHLQGLT